MIVLPELKCSGGKLASHSDPRMRIATRRTTIKKINIRTWNGRTLRQVPRLRYLALEMDNYELNVVDLSEVRWVGWKRRKSVDKLHSDLLVWS